MLVDCKEGARGLLFALDCPGRIIAAGCQHLSAAGAAELEAQQPTVWPVNTCLPFPHLLGCLPGKPLFGTLIALLHDGKPVLGIIDQPVTRERWLGVAGRSTMLNSQMIAARPCPHLGDAYLYATTPHMFAGASAEAFARLRDAVCIPLYGCDCYAYGLLAAGHCDLVAEADLKPYDYMALIPVVEGAGGVITDWAGGPLRWTPGMGDRPGEVLAAGDATLHSAALEKLAWR